MKVCSERLTLLDMLGCAGAGGVMLNGVSTRVGEIGLKSRSQAYRTAPNGRTKDVKGKRPARLERAVLGVGPLKVEVTAAGLPGRGGRGTGTERRGLRGNDLRINAEPQAPRARTRQINRSGMRLMSPSLHNLLHLSNPPTQAATQPHLLTRVVLVPLHLMPSQAVHPIHPRLLLL